MFVLTLALPRSLFSALGVPVQELGGCKRDEARSVDQD